MATTTTGRFVSRSSDTRKEFCFQFASYQNMMILEHRPLLQYRRIRDSNMSLSHHSNIFELCGWSYYDHLFSVLCLKSLNLSQVYLERCCCRHVRKHHELLRRMYCRKATYIYICTYAARSQP